MTLKNVTFANYSTFHFELDWECQGSTGLEIYLLEGSFYLRLYKWFYLVVVIK